MEWNVLLHDFNADKIISWNIFNSYKFSSGVEDLLKEDEMDFDTFVEKLTRLIKYCFWSKVEYELMIAGMFSKNDREEKWDVSMQLLPNVEILAKYILNENNLNLKN